MFYRSLIHDVFNRAKQTAQYYFVFGRFAFLLSPLTLIASGLPKGFLGGGRGGSNRPSQFPKDLQNCAKLYPRKRPGTNFTEGWVVPSAGLDGRNISPPTGNRFPDRAARSQSLYRLSYPTHCWCAVVSELRQRKKYKLGIIGKVTVTGSTFWYSNPGEREIYFFSSK